MKFFTYTLFIIISIVMSGCANKQTEIVKYDKLYDYDVKTKAQVVSSDNGTIIYKIDIPDITGVSGNTYSPENKRLELDVTIKQLDKKGKIFAIKYLLDERISPSYHKQEFLAPGLQLLMSELEKNGDNYFQIIAPLSISNIEGFPINNLEDFTSFIAPETNNPSDDTDLQNETGYHSTILGGIEFVIMIVDNPTPKQIVWDVKRNLQ